MGLGGPLSIEGLSNVVVASPSNGQALAYASGTADWRNATIDLTALVALAPASSARNVVQPTGPSYVPLTLKGASLQAANLVELRDAAGALLSQFSAAGGLAVGVASPSYTMDFLSPQNKAMRVRGANGGGIIFGAYDGSYGGIWASNTTPTSSNYMFLSDGSNVVMNAPTGGAIQFAMNDASTKFKINDTGVAFYGGATVAQQTVTGSRGANAALASLLTALAALGLVVDGSS